MTRTESSGKSSNAVTHFGLALHGRIARSPKNAKRPAAGSPAPHDDRLVAGRVPAGRHDRHAGQDLALAVGPALGAPVADEPQLGLVVARDEPRVVAERDLPLRPLGDDPRPREGPPARPRRAARRRGRSGGGSAPRRRPCRVEARRRERRQDRLARRSPRLVRSFSSVRSPIPVSTSTRPAGVSTSRQLSAWTSRWSAVSSALTRRSQSSRGTGPKTAPASVRNVPAWTSATVVPPPRLVDQSTASFRLTARALPRSAQDRVGSSRGRPVEVAVERRRGRLGLALVLRAELGRAVRPLDRARHLEEADLADPHPEVERDRQVGDVGQLEGQVALPARVDVAGGRVDEQPEPAKRAVVRRDERPRGEEHAARRRDLDAPDRDRRHLARRRRSPGIGGIERPPPSGGPASCGSRKTGRSGVNFDPVLRPVVDAVQRGAPDRLDRAEAEARRELDDGVGEALARARELAAPGDVVDEAIGVHQALQQGEPLRRCPPPGTSRGTNLPWIWPMARSRLESDPFAV